MPAGPDEEQLRLLLRTVASLASDLTMDGVLQRIVEEASRLSGARYAALGVLGTRPEEPLQEFVHHGMTDAEVTSIGELPSGRGLLGLIIERPEPLRLDAMSGHPASYGFPPNHPPMTSFLGVPVRIGDIVFGNLYLTEKQGGGAFTEQDEETVVALAAAAGVVIENARLYEEAERRERWLAATAEITAVLLGPASRRDAMQLVADRAREAAGADLAFIVLRDSTDALRIDVFSGPEPDLAMSPVLPMAGTMSGLVVEKAEAVVVEDIRADPRVSTTAGLLVGWPQLGSAMMVPLRTVAGADGLVTLGWFRTSRRAFHAVDVELPQRFAEQTALALQIARGREDAAALALLEDRDRIAKDLHDLVIQRLFAIGLSLDNASRQAGLSQLADRVTDAVDEIDATIKEIRRTIFALNAPADSTDVRVEIATAIDQATGALGFAPSLSTEGPLNAAVPSKVVPQLLAVLREALSNAVRHAAATYVRVSVSAVGDEVTLTVVDDGRGIAPHTRESGLQNMRDRAAALGGSCQVESSVGRGTAIVWRIPRPADH